jgi:hypothetical protein
MARAVTALLIGMLLLPVGVGGIMSAVRSGLSFLEASVSLVLCMVVVASFRGAIRSLNHYRHPSSLIMDEAGIELVDVYRTRRWAWTDIVGATTGRGTIFIMLIVRQSVRNRSYVDIGPWPEGTLREILVEKDTRSTASFLG